LRLQKGFRLGFERVDLFGDRGKRGGVDQVRDHDVAIAVVLRGLVFSHAAERASPLLPGERRVPPMPLECHLGLPHGAQRRAAVTAGALPGPVYGGHPVLWLPPSLLRRSDCPSS
jgi:hypothetical protein